MTKSGRSATASWSTRRSRAKSARPLCSTAATVTGRGASATRDSFRKRLREGVLDPTTMRYAGFWIRVIAKFIDKRGEGLHHVAIKVPDLAGAVARLKSSGSRLMNDPRPGAGGHLYVFVHPSSTGGVLLELIQE